VSVITTARAERKVGKPKTIVWRLVTALLAAMFVLSGYAKFVDPRMAEQFVHWGYSDASRVLVGVIEIGGGLALLLPQTAFYGAAALAIVMGGAAFTHLSHSEIPEAAVPLVLLNLLVNLASASSPASRTRRFRAAWEAYAERALHDTERQP